MLQAGQTAPGFTLPDLHGSPQALAGRLRQGRVLLVFFKISCETCHLTLPFLNGLKGHLPVLAISQDDAAGTAEFLEELGIEYPVLLDPAADRYPVSQAYGIDYVPSLFLVESDGSIAWSSEGFVRDEFAARLGAGLLAGQENVPALKPGCLAKNRLCD